MDTRFLLSHAYLVRLSEPDLEDVWTPPLVGLGSSERKPDRLGIVRVAHALRLPHHTDSANAAGPNSTWEPNLMCGARASGRRRILASPLLRLGRARLAGAAAKKEDMPHVMRLRATYSTLYLCFLPSQGPTVFKTNRPA